MGSPANGGKLRPGGGQFQGFVGVYREILGASAQEAAGFGFGSPPDLGFRIPRRGKGAEEFSRTPEIIKRRRVLLTRFPGRPGIF